MFLVLFVVNCDRQSDIMRSIGPLFINPKGSFKKPMRYSNYHLLIGGFLISKIGSCSAKNLPHLKSLKIEGGHFKLASLHVEHGLIFSALAGQPPMVEVFVHGKRRRPTALLSATLLSGRNMNPVLDKFINVTLPNVEDLGDLQLGKPLARDSTYT